MPDRPRSIEIDVVIGAIAGIVATTAMTLSMAAMFRRLDRPERYPLPPRELTERTAAAAGIRHELDEPPDQPPPVPPGRNTAGPRPRPPPRMRRSSP